MRLSLISALAAASVALAGCEQDPNRNNEAGTEPIATGDGTMSGDAATTDETTGIDTLQEPDAVEVPLLDPTVPPSTDDRRGETGQPDEVLEQPADTVRDAPQ